ncbi:MAG TPA: hypothetical protein VKU79_05025 [Thermoplasmataceae archaeon]|nr:hypothetical protein [Thermoplasmataceae archaeon]
MHARTLAVGFVVFIIAASALVITLGHSGNVTNSHGTGLAFSETSVKGMAHSNMTLLSVNLSGVPTGDLIAMSIGNSTFSTDNGHFEVMLPAGIYQYSVENSMGYFSPASKGFVNLSGGSVNLTIHFAGVFSPTRSLDIQNLTLLPGSAVMGQLNVTSVASVYDQLSNNLFIATSNNLIVDYNLTSNSISWADPGISNITSLSVDTRDSSLIIASYNGLYTYFFRTNETLQSFNISGNVTQILYDGAGNTVFVATESGLYTVNLTTDFERFVTGGSFTDNSLTENYQNGTVFALDNYSVVLEISSSGNNVKVIFSGSQYNALLGPILSISYSELFNGLIASVLSFSTPTLGLISNGSIQYMPYYGTAIEAFPFDASGVIAVSNSNPYSSSLVLFNLSTYQTLLTEKIDYSFYSIPVGNGVAVFLNSGPVYIYSVHSAVHKVTFQETPRINETWGIFVNNVTIRTNSTTIDTYLPNGTTEFEVLPPQGWGYLGMDTANVSGESTIDIQFSRVYPVYFNETGLPAGDFWSVNISNQHFGSVAPSIAISLPNGSYNFSIASNYSASPFPHNGTITVNGESREVEVSFSRFQYSLSIVVNGLPQGTVFGFSIDGVFYSYVPSAAPGSEFTLDLPNGTYTLQLLPVQGYIASMTEAIVVINGTGVVERINFVPVLFSVTIGLVGYTGNGTWTLTLNNASTFSGNETYIVLNLPNGTYRYSLTFSNHIFRAAEGEFLVDNRSLSFNITVIIERYPVIFRETGLPENDLWGVNLSGTIYRGISQISVNLTNGSYQYAIIAPENFRAYPQSGVFAVNGSAITINITFKVSYSVFDVVFVPLYLPHGLNMVVDLNGTYYFSNNHNFIVIHNLTNGTYTIGIMASTKSGKFLPGGFFGHLLIDNSSGIVLPVFRGSHVIGVISIGCVVTEPTTHSNKMMGRDDGNSWKNIASVKWLRF